MLSPRLIPRLVTTVCALALAVGGTLAPSAFASAVKGAAPSLTIEAKACSIGPTEDLRSATVTALALLGTTGERVTMRFSVQSRQGKTRWKSLLFKDPGTTKKWETTEAAGAGLKLTKIFPKLPEGYEYRVAIEARSIDEDGKVVTKTARKYVLCKQPLFTPTITLGKVVLAKKAPADAQFPTRVESTSPGQPPTAAAAAPDQGFIVIPVKNLGRLPSDDLVLTVAKADTREVLAQFTAAQLKGSAGARFVINLPADCSLLYLTLQPKNAAPTDLTAAQVATVDCKAIAAAASARRR